MPDIHVTNEGHSTTTKILYKGEPVPGVVAVDLNREDGLITVILEAWATVDTYAAYRVDRVLAAWAEVAELMHAYDVPVGSAPVPQGTPLIHIEAESGHNKLIRANRPDGVLLHYVWVQDVSFAPRHQYPFVTLLMRVLAEATLTRMTAKGRAAYLTRYEAELRALVEGGPDEA